MKLVKLYFATIIGPLITAAVFILVDSFKSTDISHYLIREIKQTGDFILVGLIVSSIAVALFRKKVTGENTDIYLYWVKVFSLTLCCLCLMEVFHRGVTNINDIFFMLGLMLIMVFIPFWILGLTLGIIYTPMIKFVLKKQRLL
jgi:hypothetical protein